MILPVPQLTKDNLIEFAQELGIKVEEVENHIRHYEQLAKNKKLLPELTFNPVTIAMTSVERSEHCCYPHSKTYIQKLIKAGESRYPLVHGAESGGFELPDGTVVLFKMESHNHPSEKEPFQGAATGVGGIIRDILAMGVRPLALLDSLYFGPETDTKSMYIFRGVVSGISWYGNCVGLPNLGGQTLFGRGHLRKTLVNVMCVGVGKKEHLVPAKAHGIGNKVLIVGNDTGPDGIGGASILASSVYKEGQENRATIQVGDPFREKLLIEAYLECVFEGLIEACKDMGAAGLTCTTTEMCEEGGVGMNIDLASVPLRIDELHAHEAMMSESQERMLVIIKPENVEQVVEIFHKWELHAKVIGEVTEDPLLYIKNNGDLIAVADPEYMVNGPTIPLKPKKPTHLQQLRNIPAIQEPDDYGMVLLNLLSSPNIASKRWVFRQYDRSVMTNTVTEAGAADAGVIRVKGSLYGLAFSTDCNPRYCYLDPNVGAKIAVAEAARNLVCVGAEPVALTDCLNFGDPDDPEVGWQFEETVQGMIDALNALNVCIISGNVSFYNQDDSGPIFPTPTIGMVGVVKDVEKTCTPAFEAAGDKILLVGPEGKGELGGSEYLTRIQDQLAGKPPTIDLEMEQRVQHLILHAIEQGFLSSAHDCSDGGLAVALAESCILGECGAKITLDRVNARYLFGEDQSRVIVSLKDPKQFVELAKEYDVPVREIGQVGGEEFIIEVNGKEEISLPVTSLSDSWYSAFD